MRAAGCGVAPGSRALSRAQGLCRAPLPVRRTLLNCPLKATCGRHAGEGVLHMGTSMGKHPGVGHVQVGRRSREGLCGARRAWLFLCRRLGGLGGLWAEEGCPLTTPTASPQSCVDMGLPGARGEGQGCVPGAPKVTSQGLAPQPRPHLCSPLPCESPVSLSGRAGPACLTLGCADPLLSPTAPDPPRPGPLGRGGRVAARLAGWQGGEGGVSGNCVGKAHC